MTPWKSLATASMAAVLGLAVTAGAAHAAAMTYQVDPSHTYPSFEADHMGLSTWRGKFNQTRGQITLDREAGSGFVSVTIDTDSIDFGHAQMNSVAKGESLFDVAQFPWAAYSGTLAGFVDGAPSRVDGVLTLRGTSRPVALEILRFKCAPHPLLRREVCGADALGRFQRDDFGMDAGKSFGFGMEVTLRIQVEAIRDN